MNDLNRASGSHSNDSASLNWSSRRRFLQQLAAATTCAGLASMGSSLSIADDKTTPLEPGSEQKLQEYAFELIPMLDRSHHRYLRVAKKVSTIAKYDTGMAKFIEQGLAALDPAGKKAWSKLAPSERTQRIQKLEGTPFFGFLRWTTSEIVMREPTLWKRLGYEGSSLEHGGYLHRGFDDLDWLPKTNTGLRKP